MSAAELLSDLLAGPDLHGAACVGRHDVFDDCIQPGRAASKARSAALKVCAGCPVLGTCRRWVLSLPKSKRPAGVTGGVIRRSR